MILTSKTFKKKNKNSFLLKMAHIMYFCFFNRCYYAKNHVLKFENIIKNYDYFNCESPMFFL